MKTVANLCLPLVDGTQVLFQLFSKLQRVSVFTSFQKHKYLEPHGKPAMQQPEAIIVPKVPLDGELRGHAPSATQACFNRMSAVA